MGAEALPAVAADAKVLVLCVYHLMPTGWPSLVDTHGGVMVEVDRWNGVVRWRDIRHAFNSAMLKNGPVYSDFFDSGRSRWVLKTCLTETEERPV